MLRKKLENEANQAKAELEAIKSGTAGGAKQPTQEEAEREAKVMADINPKLQAMQRAYHMFLGKIEAYPQRKRTRVEIKKRVNQISGTQDQINARTKDLQKIIADSDRVNDPVWSTWVLVQVAENLVTKGDTRVHLKRSAAFPIAIAAYRLVMFRPPLLDIMLGLMFQKCCYTGPLYPDATAANWKQAAGYKEEGDEKKLELEEKYLERMGGHMALCAAFMQIPDQNHPFGLKMAWKWLVRIINQEPCHATAVILESFLDVAGYEMSRTYGRQFEKLLVFIENDFWARLPQVPGPQMSARVRIRQFLTKCKQDGKLQIPEGKNPADSYQR